MENKGDLITGGEQQKTPEILKIGQSVQIPLGKTVLFGRGEDLVDGYLVYKIEGLEDNLVISNYALGIEYGGGYKKIITRPKLNLGGVPYEGKNKIIIDTRDEEIPVTNECITGDAGEITFDQVVVGDEDMNNGFIIQNAGNDTVKLISVISNGKDL